jgi:deoxyribonuclease-4
MTIKFGPAGLGSVKEAVSRLEEYHKLGLRACEIAFTYGVYIKEQKDAELIGKKAKELGISLSIHAPYWINLNSLDKSKIEQSKERILNCLKVGTWLQATRVVFHSGFYGKSSKEETYENIKNQILEIQKIAKEKKYTPKLCPETMGKVNVFGSVSEISKLSKETGCDFCIDFAHILAREKNYNFKETLKQFEKFKELHIHFSGIVYNEKGERHHKATESKEWKELLANLPENKDFIIINEAPDPIKDSVGGLSIYNKQRL